MFLVSAATSISPSMTEINKSKFTFSQKLIAYVLFLSIVVRFIFCQLTKNLNDEKQFQEFRYFSFAGFIGFLIALGINEVLSLPNLAIVAIWMILF